MKGILSVIAVCLVLIVAMGAAHLLGQQPEKPDVYDELEMSTARLKCDTERLKNSMDGTRHTAACDELKHKELVQAMSQ